MDFIDLKTQQQRIKEKIYKRIQNVLDHGKYIMGPEVIDLENQLAKYVGVDHCITCSSGTDALLIPLMAKNIGIGDAIITTPFTYIATAEVISLLGATPVFCDIYPDTFNIDPDKLQISYDSALKMNLNPKAIIPVDLFGLPSRYRIIKDFADKFGLFVLEDGAQGFGGEIRSQKVGSFGDAATTSFFPAKPLGCYGDGGAIFTNDQDLAEKMKSIRVHGSGLDKYDNVRIGINGRLDTIQAAILLEKLSIFPEEVIKRNEIAKYYKNNLPSNLSAPFIPSGYYSSWAQFSIIANSNQERDLFLDHLKEKNIPTGVYYSVPLHLQKVFNNLNNKIGDFPVAEKIAKTIFSIPMHPYLKKSQQDEILEALNYEI